MKNSKVAFLWDESFLWGIMAYKALRSIGLPFDLIRAADISKNVLAHYTMLFVPGGWASNKSKALGEDGIGGIRRFVESGGSYLGFCGGAGLATKTKGGIGLLDVQRKPTRERVPSFSGRIEIDVNDHPIWEGLMKGSGIRGRGSGEDDLTLRIQNPQNASRTTDGERRTTNIFHAWWPSQFVVTNETVKSLASFGKALPDAFSSDLPAGDVTDSGNWDDLEKRYGIHLNPERLIGEPAVVEGSFGKGKVILSLLHFDTPGDRNGQEVLIQLWNYLAGETQGVRGQGSGVRGTYEAETDGNIIREMYDVCAELISLGERNLLWFWRNAMLLQWRRGVRGLEYNTLYVLIKEIANIMDNKNYTDVSQCVSAPASTQRMLNGFVEKAKNLLLLERLELQRGPITYNQCEDPHIQKLRKQLFGGAKSHGGMFKKVLDEVDGLLYELLTNC